MTAAECPHARAADLRPRVVMRAVARLEYCYRRSPRRFRLISPGAPSSSCNKRNLQREGTSGHRGLPSDVDSDVFAEQVPRE